VTVAPGIPEFGSASLSRRQIASSVLILLLVTWFGNFFEFEHFTLYSDDWAFLGQVFKAPYTFATWVNSLIPYADGRPIQSGLIVLTGVIINQTHRLIAAYLFAYVVAQLSVLAVWRALAYRFSNRLALIATCVFAISPLVSIRPFLNNIAAPASFLFLMVAGILYISGRRIFSYVVAALILLSYEMIFPLFALLPVLLRPLRTRRDLYRLFGHIAICLVMLVIYALLREKYGSSRLNGVMAGHDAGEIALGILSAIGESIIDGSIGSIDISLWGHRIGPVPTALTIWGILGFAGFAYILHRSEIGAEKTTRDPRLMLQTLAIVLLLVPAGYALVYFGAPDGAQSVFGRVSRFHEAADLPFAILTAMILVGLLDLAGRSRWRHAVIAIEAGYLGLLFALSISHQEEFVAASERQRLLVTQLAMDQPRMDPDATFIIRLPYLDVAHLPSIDYDDGHAYYFILRDLFDFRDRTGRPGPAIRIVYDDKWPERLTQGPDGRLYWPAGTWPAEPEQAGHIWYYAFSVAGELQRLSGPVMVGGRDILHEGGEADPGTVDLASLTKSRYYPLIMGRDAALVDMALRPSAPVEPPTN
jgi:hypothetical protein